MKRNTEHRSPSRQEIRGLEAAAALLRLPDQQLRAMVALTRGMRALRLGTHGTTPGVTKFDPNELRDWRGRWTSEGAARPAASAPGRAKRPRPSAAHFRPPERAKHSELSSAYQAALSEALTAALHANKQVFQSWTDIENALGQGRPGDPGAGRLVSEWRTGEGPQTRVLGASTEFSQQFAQAPSTKEGVSKALATWRSQPGGLTGSLSRPVGVSFGPQQVIEDTLNPNPAAHVIGSFVLDGVRRGNTIRWRATNYMTLQSFFAGHWLERLNLPMRLLNVDRPNAFGTTTQLIYWETDVDGHYIRHRRK